MEITAYYSRLVEHHLAYEMQLFGCFDARDKLGSQWIDLLELEPLIFCVRFQHRDIHKFPPP